MRQLILMMAFVGALLGVQPANAQTFDQLWKRHNEVAEKDLPKTQIDVLEKIAAKAQKEKAYGQLLAASLKKASVQNIVSPDSLQPIVDDLAARAAEAEKKDEALAAIYNAVLYEIFHENSALGDDRADQAKAFRAKAMAHPDVLAATKATGFTPLITDGIDATIFGDDLLNIIARQTNSHALARDYYDKAGNREAACLMALDALDKNDDRYADQLDSLISIYGDLSVCGEVAVARLSTLHGTTKQRYDYCTDAISRWPSWTGIDKLRNEQTALTTPQIVAEVKKNVIAASSSQKITIQTRHIDKAQLTIVRLNVSGDTELQPYNKDELKELRRFVIKGTEQTIGRTYGGNADYEFVNDTLELPGLPVGVYLLTFSAPNNSDVEPLSMLYRVTNIFPLWTNWPQKKMRLAVVDFKTGQPIAKAQIQLKNDKQTITTNEQGEIVITPKKNSYYKPIHAFTETDKASPAIPMTGSYWYNDNSSYFATKAHLFTDRGIYRPGQTVHVAAVLYDVKNLVETQAKAHEDITLTLRDANYQIVSEQTITTDDFGSVSADFTLPTSGLTGRFNIQSKYGGCSFQVEEYKRPTFEVIIDSVETTYRAGDTLIVVGRAKTYAGVPVQGAAVNYAVSRMQPLWWWHWRNTNLDKNDYKEEGTATTDAQGAFTMQVPLLVGDDFNERTTAFFNFNIVATITDKAGESREGRLSIPLGTKATAFTCDVPQKVRADQLPKITFGYKNAGGKDLPGTVVYRLDKGREQRTKANTPFTLAATLASGLHTLTAICGTDTLEQQFTVFSLTDQCPATTTNDWFYQSATEFPDDGQPVYIQVGSSDEQVHVFYDVFSGDSILESGSFDLSNAIHTRQLTYKEAYGAGLTIIYAWVKDQILYKHEAKISRAMPDKHLTMTWKTFRDRLTPGQDEEWTLAITHPDGTPANAQLMATLYDKSLDQIETHSWLFNAINNNYNLPATQWRGMDVYGWNHASEAFVKSLRVKELSLRAFDQSYYDNLLYGYLNQYARIGRPLLARGASAVYCNIDKVEAACEPAAGASLNEVAVADYGTMKQMAFTDMVADGTVGESESNVEACAVNGTPTLRENLQETAFFYPKLTTDKNGIANITFRLPESVTTWRFIGMAHDQQMNSALMDAEAVATKAVMVSPNMPRFTREGDEATITARVFNTTDKALTGTAHIAVIPAETVDQVPIFSDDAAFAIDGNATQIVSFRLPATLSASLYIVRITADGRNFSDGEQHYMPILTSQEYITTTQPITLIHAADTVISLQRLFPDGTSQRRLTVEYTQHPEWLVLQALPYMAVPDGDNAISLVTAYYANELGRSLLSNNKAVKRTIDQWSRETSTETTLMSQLEKDQELKSLVLSETPWVAAATAEREQRQSLVRFFDDNALNNNIATIWQKLSALQRSDGSFSWWKDMEGSPYMTMAVVKTLARLETLTGQRQTDVATMLNSAFRFLDKEVTERVAELRKWEKKHDKVFPSDFLCDYVYVSALRGRAVTSDMFYIVDRLEREPSVLSIYGKANTAIILHQYGRERGEVVARLLVLWGDVIAVAVAAGLLGGFEAGSSLIGNLHEVEVALGAKGEAHAHLIANLERLASDILAVGGEHLANDGDARSGGIHIFHGLEVLRINGTPTGSVVALGDGELLRRVANGLLHVAHTGGGALKGLSIHGDGSLGEVGR